MNTRPDVAFGDAGYAAHRQTRLGLLQAISFEHRICSHLLPAVRRKEFTTYLQPSQILCDIHT